jgi:hypothetical protein
MKIGIVSALLLTRIFVASRKHGDERSCTQLPPGSTDSTEPIIDPPPNEPFDPLVTRAGQPRAV